MQPTVEGLSFSTKCLSLKILLHNTNQDSIAVMIIKIGLLAPFFLLVLCKPGLGSVVKKQYLYYRYPTTWWNAQSYCRRSKYNSDLAILYTQSDADSLRLEPYDAWIGLHKSDSGQWKWSNGDIVSNHWWWPKQPYSYSDCAYVSSISKRIYGARCGQQKFIICQEYNSQTKFLPKAMTWHEAKLYCSNEYQDLANLETEDNITIGVYEQDFPVWTGLHRDKGSWKWSKGLSEYRNWTTAEPSNNSDCVSISSLSKQMFSHSCSEKFPFVCLFDNLVLVKENKTWEEALDYCRVLRSPSYPHIHHDLVSVQPGIDHSNIMTKVMEADTEKVWVGLRFLADHWLWINSAHMLYADLPICPHRKRCGALSKTNNSVQTRDCTERRNFLCYALNI